MDKFKIVNILDVYAGGANHPIVGGGARVEADHGWFGVAEEKKLAVDYELGEV